jgi:hypothetical protein
MAVNTYFGTGKMTAIYLGAVEIMKIYLGSALVYTSTIPPPATKISYINFDLDLQALPKNNNNVYTDFNLDLQPMKPIE